MCNTKQRGPKMKKYTVTVYSAYKYPRYTETNYSVNSVKEARELFNALSRALNYQINNREIENCQLETNCQI